jgi:DNA-binding NarL/FixJ family response regulator
MRAGQCSVRVVVLEDEPLYLDLLVRGLDALPEIEVTGSYLDGPSLLRDLHNAAPQAAILDLVLQPGSSPVDRTSGIQIGLALRDLIPGIGIILLSNHADPRVLTRIPVHQQSGWAYLLKGSTADLSAVQQVLHAVVSGTTMVDPRVLDHLDVPQASEPPINPHAMRVLAAVATGASNTSIAQDLGVTVRSVENTISALVKSLDIDTKSGAVNARVALTLSYLALVASAAR